MFLVFRACWRLSRTKVLIGSYWERRGVFHATAREHMDVESRDHAALPASPGVLASLLQAFINYLLRGSTLTSIPSIKTQRGGGLGEVSESISQHAEVKAE